MLTVTPDGESNIDLCVDWGNPTRMVWGYVANEKGAYAVYLAWWTPSHFDRGAQLLISIDGWGEGADPARKHAVALDSQIGEDRPGFAVINASDTPLGDNEDLGRMLSREEVFATGAAQDAFRIIDHLVYADPRLKAFYFERP